MVVVGMEDPGRNVEFSAELLAQNHNQYSLSVDTKFPEAKSLLKIKVFNGYTPK